MSNGNHNEIMRELGSLNAELRGLRGKVDNGFKEVKSDIKELGREINKNDNRINELEKDGALFSQKNEYRQKRINRKQSYKDWAIRGIIAFITLFLIAVLAANMSEVGDTMLSIL